MKYFFSKTGTLVSIALMLLFLGLSHLLQSRADRQSPYDVNLTQFPETFGDWKGVDSDELSLRSQSILQLDQYVRRVYANSKGQRVFVYIGYWKKQNGEHQAAKHSPLMCLPANGWTISSPKPRTVAITTGPEGSAHTSRELVGQIKDDTVLFYYWFFSGERTYLDETEALFYIMKETLFHARSDGGIVELSAELNPALSPAEADTEAHATMDAFIRDFYPVLAQAVQRRRTPGA
jgi:EpsI family protein